MLGLLVVVHTALLDFAFEVTHSFKSPSFVIEHTWISNLHDCVPDLHSSGQCPVAHPLRGLQTASLTEQVFQQVRHGKRTWLTDCSDSKNPPANIH